MKTNPTAPRTRNRLFRILCDKCDQRNRKQNAYCIKCGARLRPEGALKSSRFARLKLAGLVLVIVGLNVLPTAYTELLLSQTDATIIQSANAAGLSHRGQLLLASAHPTNTANVVKSCHLEGSTSAGFREQGCYIFLENTIYVQKPAEQFAGLKTVTVAHEMLHVAYGRTFGLDSKLNKLLEDEVAKGNLPGLKEKLAYYDKAEPGMRDNELHSILGTEYANLSPELEQYYSQYFVDRKRVVAANAQIMKPLDDLMALMNSLQSQADAFQKTSDGYLAQNASAAKSGNASAANHYYDLYTQAFNSYSAKEAEYNAVVVKYNALADQYNGQP